VSKSTENILLVPGEAGWEIWSSPSKSEYSLHSATNIELAGDLTDLPPGDLVLLFPVKSITALPLRVASHDEALFPDLAALHAERLGLRPDPMAGQLTDIFVMGREGENTGLLSVLLRVPSDGELPSRGPKGFDVSPRAFPLAGESVAVWKEFGRWVFAISHQGNLAYCQATSVTAGSPDGSLAREIRLALMQLSMQGLDLTPSRIVVWSSISEISVDALSAAFRIPIEFSPRPAPVSPSPLSKLLPADVRSARRAADKKQNIMLAIAAVVLLYIGVIGWFGYGLWRDTQEIQKLVAQAEAAAPDSAAYLLHIGKWDELSNVIDLTNSPVDILKRVADCIPPNSSLRLKTADISASGVKLQGEAPLLQSVNAFSLKLVKNTDLSQFVWQTPEPNQSKLGWEFVFTAQLRTAAAP
jgi:hypothetical protein